MTTSVSREVLQRPRVLPRTDVLETDAELILIAEVPGVEPGSVELSRNDDVLNLRATPAEGSPEGWQPTDSEFELPIYERSFRLPVDIEPDGITAAVQNGLLRITLKKRTPRSTRIEVRSA